jgi:hypothetical protein
MRSAAEASAFCCDREHDNAPLLLRQRDSLKGYANGTMAAARLRIVHADGREEERSLELGRYRIGGVSADLPLYDTPVAAAVALLDVTSSRIIVRDLGAGADLVDRNGRRVTGAHELLPNDTICIAGSRITWVVPRAGANQTSDAQTPEAQISEGQGDAPALVRGIITRVPDAEFGRISISGITHSFTLEGVWRARVAPSVDHIVDVEFDEQYRIRSVFLVEDQAQAWRELMQRRRSSRPPSPATPVRMRERPASAVPVKSCIMPRACAPFRRAWSAITARITRRR